MRIFMSFCAVIAALLAHPAAAEPAAAIDYGQAATWLCRPGAESMCTSNLDALVIGADGSRTPQPFVAGADPAIDCFYVYPTVSLETSAYSDMAPSQEIQDVARSQAGRLAARCRLFMPLYRQMTLAGMRSGLAGGGQLDWGDPYRDVLAAWRWYLDHDNRGRGVVLIGHSQGTILLQRLIAEEIDGKPVQKRLVSAILAGDPSLPVPNGAVVGGVFKHVPLCTAAAQTGCAYAWGSYVAGDAQPMRYFGNDRDGLKGACVNPAAPGGGKGMLKAYLPKPGMAPANDPPWIEVIGQLSATCTTDDKGSVLSITIEPSPFDDLLGAMFSKITARPGWGLHRLDVNLTEGNILDLVEAQAASWAKR